LCLEFQPPKLFRKRFDPISLSGANVLNTDAWGAPKQGTVASQMDMIAFPTFDLGRIAAACMYIDMAQVDMGVEVSMQLCWVVIGH
jgi:hypothetical protein